MTVKVTVMQSYTTTSADIKQHIITLADPPIARGLCQADKKSRQICRDRLAPEDKFRMCLDSSSSAQECDLIPMFSRQQFLALVPEKIAIFPEDLVQLTHQFYSQQYKLPTEGFAVALRKAKLMNTICAAVRPDFLLTPAAQQLPLPSYIDTGLLDRIVREYARVQATKIIEDHIIITIRLYAIDRENYIRIDIKYRTVSVDEILKATEGYVDVRELSPLYRQEFNARCRRDHFFTYLKTMFPSVEGDFEIIPLINNIAEGPRLNVFRLSRFVKIAFDMGFYHRPTIITINGNKRSGHPL